jgi:hypothetical protein
MFPFSNHRLEFACTDNANPVPLVANEIEHCHYVVEMPSFYGCPTVSGMVSVVSVFEKDPSL